MINISKFRDAAANQRSNGYLRYHLQETQGLPGEPLVQVNDLATGQTEIVLPIIIISSMGRSFHGRESDREFSKKATTFDGWLHQRQQPSLES